MQPSPRPLPFEIDPLPDFLGDHTLAGESDSARLKEHATRWVQFVESLWSWCDRATFALRFYSRDGRTRCYFVAVPDDEREATMLAREVKTLLRSHRLVRASRDAMVSDSELTRNTEIQSASFLELAQFSPRNLWNPPPLSALGVDTRACPGTTESDWTSPPVVYAWHGAGGPFLLPMECLVSLSQPAAITVYLRPTVLRGTEWGWLAQMARISSSLADENATAIGRGAASRRVDPAATLASELYSAALGRLSSTPFLVLVQVAAGGQAGATNSLAAAMQSIPHEDPLLRERREIESLPSACMPLRENPDPDRSLGLYRDFNLAWVVSEHGLDRLPMLVDARGATTMFRLPVSIRGGVPGIAVRQFPPDFQPGPRQELLPPRSIELGRFEGGGLASVPVDDLTRHVLVTGFTGSGKTWTVLQILHQLWADHNVPFLVIESAKQEYRCLSTVPAMRAKPLPVRIYTIGNETCVPLRLNPFELQPGVRVEAHISRLQTCFEAAVPQVGPSTSIIAEALVVVYTAKGFSLTDQPAVGKPLHREFPTLVEFVEAIERIIVARGYRGELLSNLQAALVGRFKPLLIGGKGKMFDCRRSEPALEDMFRHPVVLEMNDLNLDDKALMVMFLLTALREHRERNKGARGKLVHVTVVEEAHNVLEEVASEGGGDGATKGDTRFKAVQAFCAMLAEIRSLGEGLIISDQSPQKLARDAIRNTNVQIAHQLRDGDDRRAIARAMIMEDEQRDYLGKLLKGSAALFLTGLEKATFVQVAPYAEARGNRGYGMNPNLTDDEVRNHMLAAGLFPLRAPDLPLPGCEFCRTPCAWRDPVFVVADSAPVRARVLELMKLLDRDRRAAAGFSASQVWDRYTADALRELATRVELGPDEDAGWCHFAHGWHFGAKAKGWSPHDSELTMTHREKFALSFARVRLAATRHTNRPS